MIYIITLWTGDELIGNDVKKNYEWGGGEVGGGETCGRLC